MCRLIFSLFPNSIGLRQSLRRVLLSQLSPEIIGVILLLCNFSF